MPKTAEIGRIGQHRYGVQGYGSIFMEEFLYELHGNRGVQTFEEMANNDSTVGGMLFAITMLMRKAEIHIEPGGETEKDKEAAKFIESCMYDMEKTWPETFSELLSFLHIGWSLHEICYKRRVGKTTSPVTNSKYSDGLIGWRKFAPRAQDTLEGWEYTPGTDDLVGMWQIAPPEYKRCMIPMTKALHLRTRSFKDNPEGRSILRTAYRDWYFKKRLQEIEAYGVERDLAGFPVLYAPEGMDIWNTEDSDMSAALARAEYIVSSIRRDAREGLVIPGGENGWKLELLASSGKRQFDTCAIIERYNKSIATSVLADFIMMGQQQVGSFALADSKTEIFALAIGAFMDIICEAFNSQAIPRLIDLNGDHFKGITDYPQMCHGDIENKDLQTFTTFVKEMIGAGVLTPDDELEKEIRRVGGLPEKLETETPGENPPANPQQETMESQTVYKVTNILRQYTRGETTREAAAELLANIGLNQEKINFHLSEADKVIQENAKKEQEKANQTQNAAQKPGKAPQSRRKKKQDETPVDDEEDAQKADEAKKSLGRNARNNG